MAFVNTKSEMTNVFYNRLVIMFEYSPVNSLTNKLTYVVSMSRASAILFLILNGQSK